MNATIGSTVFIPNPNNVVAGPYRVTLKRDGAVVMTQDKVDPGQQFTFGNLTTPGTYVAEAQRRSTAQQNLGTAVVSNEVVIGPGPDIEVPASLTLSL